MKEDSHQKHISRTLRRLRSISKLQKVRHSQPASYLMFFDSDPNAIVVSSAERIEMERKLAIIVPRAEELRGSQEASSNGPSKHIQMGPHGTVLKENGG